MVPTGCERAREMDFQVLLKVEGFAIKDLVFSVYLQCYIVDFDGMLIIRTCTAQENVL